jgi:hypothetical protein
MQNLILNNMQPKVQSDDERGNLSTPAVRPKVAWLGSREPLASGGSDRPQPSVRGQAPVARAQLRPGLLLKMFFWPDAWPPIKVGTFLGLRE